MESVKTKAFENLKLNSSESTSFWEQVDTSVTKVQEIPNYDFENTDELVKVLVSQFSKFSDNEKEEAIQFLKEKLQDFDLEQTDFQTEKLRDFIYEMF